VGHITFSYADDMNLLGGNIDSINKSTETLINASKGVDLGVNIEKIKCILLSRYQNADQNII
jgi:hypothetical protein